MNQKIVKVTIELNQTDMSHFFGCLCNTDSGDVKIDNVCSIVAFQIDQQVSEEDRVPV